MYKLSQTSHAGPVLEVPCSAIRRRLLVQASDSQGSAGPGLVNKPMAPNTARPMAPQPLLQPLPPRPGMIQPPRPQMPAGPGSNGSVSLQKPAGQPGMAPQPPMARPGINGPPSGTPSTAAVPNAPLQPSLRAPVAPSQQTQQQRLQPQQPTQQQRLQPQQPMQQRRQQPQQPMQQRRQQPQQPMQQQGQQPQQPMPQQGQQTQQRLPQQRLQTQQPMPQQGQQLQQQQQQQRPAGIPQPPPGMPMPQRPGVPWPPMQQQQQLPMQQPPMQQLRQQPMQRPAMQPMQNPPMRAGSQPPVQQQVPMQQQQQAGLVQPRPQAPLQQGFRAVPPPAQGFQPPQQLGLAPPSAAPPTAPGGVNLAPKPMPPPFMRSAPPANRPQPPPQSALEAGAASRRPSPMQVPLPPQQPAVPSGLGGLAPKPVPPQWQPPSGTVQMAPPGQVGLSRPAFQAPQTQQPLQRPSPLRPLGASSVELRRPSVQPQQEPAGPASPALQEISLTRPTWSPPTQQHQGETNEQVRRRTGRLGSIEVVEEDDGEVDEDEEDGKKEKGKKGKAKKGKKEKVTAEMKRAARKQRELERGEKAAAQRREKEEIFEVGEEGMSLEALADAIQVDPSEIMRGLFMKGIMLSLNQVLDRNTVKLVAAEYDLLVVDKEEAAITAGAVKQRDFLELDDLDTAVPRPPVVTVMGHVDHGKTSLLDFIRKSKVAAGEAGGITQAIGAYNVDVEVDGEKKTICFLDTPGHEAFSAMRARGARVTDLAIIIVAADDGVQPQTREAVSHAQAAEVPIVVAINKIDKPGADVERTKQGLLELNLVPEEWGGNTPMVPISAKKGIGIDDLLQTVCWVAEEKQLMANSSKLAAGTVIEAHLDKKKGPVATLLVQAGTLHVGNVMSCGACFGKVRILSNAAGSTITEAGPSIAVQMIGLNAVPQAGDEFQVHPSESDARAAASEASEELRAARIAEMSTTGSMVTLSSLATMDEDVDTLQRMNLIIKGDTSGVVEAIKGALQQLPQESVVLRYLLNAAGDITVSDVDLAAASGGMIVGFNLNPDETVQSHAKRLGVTINTYRVIYNLIDDVKAAMEGKLRAVQEKLHLGQATVKAVFGTGKKRVAGCLVDEGKLQKGAQIEVLRGKQVVHTGKVASLRRIKDNVEEVQSGLECGVGAEDFTSWQADDVINCFLSVTKTQRLEDAKAATAVDVSSL